jgi:hypothetical protein
LRSAICPVEEPTPTKPELIERDAVRSTLELRINAALAMKKWVPRQRFLGVFGAMDLGVFQHRLDHASWVSMLPRTHCHCTPRSLRFRSLTHFHSHFDYFAFDF